MRSEHLWLARQLMLGALLCGPACGQAIQSEGSNQLGVNRSGFHLYRVTASTTYTTLPLQPGLANTYLGDLNSETAVGGDLSAGWNRMGAKSSVWTTYSLAYNGSVHDPDRHGLSYAVSLRAQNTVTSKWTTALSVSAGVITATQFFFSPTIFRQLAEAPATFDDLSAALLTGTTGNGQLAAILTGSPIAESPGHTFLFGYRSLAGLMQGRLAYAQSPRLSISVAFAGSRIQHLPGGTAEANGSYGYVVPQTSSGTTTIGLSYSLSPRTQFGAEVSGGRTVSRVEDTYMTGGTGWIGRRMGRGWFVKLSAGAGVLRPLRLSYRLPGGPQFTGSASLGYSTRAHNILLSGSHSVGDAYGVGARSTLASNFAWFWRRPGSGWVLSCSAGQNLLRYPDAKDMNSWRVYAALGRAFTRRTGIEIGYAYVQSFGGPFDLAYDRGVHGARVTVYWNPGAGTAR